MSSLIDHIKGLVLVHEQIEVIAANGDPGLCVIAQSTCLHTRPVISEHIDNEANPDRATMLRMGAKCLRALADQWEKEATRFS